VNIEEPKSDQIKYRLFILSMVIFGCMMVAIPLHYNHGNADFKACVVRCMQEKDK